MSEEQKQPKVVDAEHAQHATHVWHGLLDNRYLIRVVRAPDDTTGYKGLLTITDRGGEKEVEMHRQEVGLAYGAQFGPDVDDVAAWQEIAIKVVDEGGKGEARPQGKDEG